MSDKELKRRDSDESYYSDSESYSSDRSRSYKDSDDEKDDGKPGERRAFVFMGNSKDLKELKRGMKKQKVPVDILNENKLKLSELRNKNVELTDLITKYQFENRDLRRMLKRQEVYLKKIQLQEDSMPNLIERQNNETKTLTEQIRQLRERLRTQEKRLKDAESQLDVKQRQVKQLNSLVHQKDLKKKHNLVQSVNELNQQLETKDENIRNLERHLENLEKNHKHEMGLKKARQKASNEEIEDLRKEIQRLYSQLQEKEKESAIYNIYSLQHRHKPPHRLSSSIRSTPVLHNGGQGDASLPKKNSFDEILKEKTTKRKLYSKNPLPKPPTNDVLQKEYDKAEESKQELDELERKIEQLNQNNNINNNNIKKSSALKTTKTTKNKTKAMAVNEKQRDLLLDRMKKVDESKYAASATTTSVKQPSNNTSSIFGKYQPSFLDDDNDKAFTLTRKDKIDLYSDSENTDANYNGQSKSPVFLNLNNSSNSIPKRPKNQDTSLATLNGIESDDEVN